MDVDEARQLRSAKVDELRALSYSELVQSLLDNPQTHEVAGPSGTSYQLECQAFWDGRRRGNLRVMVSVDDGGWRAFLPEAEDFIVAPDGTFIGE